MVFDKLSLFADGLTIPVTANGVTYSKVIDLRKCGNIGIDGILRLWAGIVGTANTTGSITTKLQTFAGDGTGVTDLVSETQNGNDLMAIMLPCKGLKRFLRMTFTVGGTALGSAVTVKAGLVDQFDIEELPEIQAFPPLEDLAGQGDEVNTALDTAANEVSIAQGASGTIAIKNGVVAAVTTVTGVTVTVYPTYVSFAVASSCTTGSKSITLTGSTGATETITVTVTAA